MKMKSTIVVLSLLTVALPAYSGIHLEPYGSYATGNASADSTLRIKGVSPDTKTSTSDTTLGSAVGGKLGFSLGPIAIGGDYMQASFGDSEIGTTNIGAFARLGLPFIKFSATYFMSSKAVMTDVTANGSGIKAGIGFSVFPFVNFNVEYLNLNFTSASTTKTNAEFMSFSQKVDAVLIGLSLPLL